MQCEVLLFAQVRETLGKSRLTIELPARATVGDALNALAAQHPEIAMMRSRLAVAVNEKYQSASTILHDGDVMALIPPVSGG
jgi:molybdopterin converting factor subunit 1